MQYINKNTGTLGANLDYQGSGKWSLHVSDDNRFRVLTGNDDNIKAIDINLMAGMIEVGKPLPGYNKVIESIEHVVEDDGTDEGREFFEVTCYLK